MNHRIGRTRLQEVRSNLPPTVGPQSIGIALTNACNLNCITCWSYSPLRSERPNVDWMRRRLSRDTLQTLFAEAAALKTERVIFTGGGDPLAHPEIYDVIGDAKMHGLKVTLISNLTLSRSPERLAALGIDTLLANFSSGDPESYVAFHPNRTADDFPRLLSLISQMANSGTQVKLVFVICAVNIRAIPKVLEIASQIGASVQFKVMSAIEDTRSIALTEEMRCDLLAQSDALIARSEELQITVNWDTLLAELSGTTPTDFPIAETGCYAGHYYARVTAGGDVFYCCNQHPALRIGSLLDTTFTELWQSERWQQVRTRLHSGKFVGGCGQCGKFDLNRKVFHQLQTVA